MQVEHDQVGAVLAGELEPDRRLHRGEQLDGGISLQDPFHEREVGEVVLDVEDHLALAGAAGEFGRLSIVRSGLVLAGGPLSAGELDRDRGAGAGFRGDLDRPAHRLEQPF